MAFEAREFSLHDSQPVEYYRFERGGEFFYYNPTKKDEVFVGNTYQSTVLKRDTYRQNKDSVVDKTMKLTCKREFEIAQFFKLIVPETTIWLTIFRKHRGDPDSEARIVWVGRVRGCQWSGSTAELQCEPIGSMVKRAGLRMNYQRNCNHFVYSSSCGVDRVTHRAIGTVTAIDEFDVYSSVFSQVPDQYFRLGFIEMNDYFYMIVDHVGDRVTLFAPLEGVVPSDTIVAYPGCDKALETCWNKFNNGLNFGGFAWHPEENIFLTGIGH